jgi:3-hydroxyisobutyrate dehydrogenase-like beta-hydroxyacid dehydrogenase
MTDGPAVGFLGLGAIGAPIAERLLRQPGRLTVFDVRPQALAPFAGKAEIARSPAEVADKADIVLACLAGAEDYRQAILGGDGLLRGGRARTYVHLGTSGARLVRLLAEELSGRGIATLDAPMTGGPPRARTGTLTAMAAGARAAFDLAEPLMRAYASKIVYLGERLGAAQMMKLVNNAVSLANFAVAAEAMVVGAKAGIAPEAMLEVLNSGSGQNSATLTKIPDHVLPGSFDYGGSLRIVTKDLELFQAEAAELGLAARLSAEVLRLYQETKAAGAEADDMTTVIRPMESAAGVEIRATGGPAAKR